MAEHRAQRTGSESRSFWHQLPAERRQQYPAFRLVLTEPPLSREVSALKQLAERFESIPETEIIAEELPNEMKQWLQSSCKAAA